VCKKTSLNRSKFSPKFLKIKKAFKYINFKVVQLKAVLDQEIDKWWRQGVGSSVKMKLNRRREKAPSLWKPGEHLKS
jgi:hypothetical protein